MARSKKSGIASLWIWLLLLVGGFLAWRYQQKGTLIDDSGAAGRVNAAVDDALAGVGVRDSQVIKSLRVERAASFPIPRSWIETERHFSGVSQRAAEKVFIQVQQSSESLNLNLIRKDASAARTLLELGRKPAVYQRLVFLHDSVKSRGKSLAIVIDDVAGRPGDLERLEPYFALGIPITFALLPQQRDTGKAAELIHRAGHEVILHQPMEPKDSKHNPPGNSALLISMSAEQVRRRLEENLSDVPHVSGFSNHMGSGFTGHAPSVEAMISAAKALEDKFPGLYFLDSHTTQKLPSPQIATRHDLPHLVNDLFLDNVDSVPAMIAQLEKARSIAERKGRAIAIGHIQRRHMTEALKRAVPQFKREGVQFVKLSELLR